MLPASPSSHARTVGVEKLVEPTSVVVHRIRLPSPITVFNGQHVRVQSVDKPSLHIVFIHRTQRNSRSASLINSLALHAIRSRQSSNGAMGPVMESAITARLDLCLAPFFIDTDGFRNLMRDLGLLLSGSFALHFFTDDPLWRPTDLDIYVSHERFIEAMNRLHVDHGFTIISQRTSYSYLLESTGVWYISKFHSPKGPSVDLICSGASAIYPIPHFWATHLMNVVSADYAIAAYPDSVFSKRAAINSIKHCTPTTDADIQRQHENTARYVARGYSFFVGSPDDAPSTGQLCWREFGDGRCLVVGFTHSDPVTFKPSIVDALGGFRVLWTFGHCGDIQIVSDVGEFLVVRNSLPVGRLAFQRSLSSLCSLSLAVPREPAHVSTFHMSCSADCSCEDGRRERS